MHGVEISPQNCCPFLKAQILTLQDVIARSMIFLILHDLVVLHFIYFFPINFFNSQGSVIVTFTITFSSSSQINNLTNAINEGKIGNLLVSLVKIVNNMGKYNLWQAYAACTSPNSTPARAYNYLQVEIVTKTRNDLARIDLILIFKVFG